MPTQTRVAFLAEYRNARQTGDFDRALEIGLAAMEYDAANPDEPSLMDEIRGLHLPAAA